MNAPQAIAVSPVPTRPTWDELAEQLKLDCRHPTVTPDSTFVFKYKLSHNGNVQPHTFCPISARCEKMSHFLAGITSLGDTKAIYLTSHVSVVDGVMLFGHINIPKNDWDYKDRGVRIRKCHVRLYSRHSNDTVMEGPRFNFIAEKKRIIAPGPTRNQKFWDIRQENISINNPEVPAELAIFVVSLTKSLGDFLDFRYRNTVWQLFG